MHYQSRAQKENKMKSMTEMFEEIYQQKAWVVKHNNPSSLSGPGSFTTATGLYHEFLKEFLERNQIRTVVDYGCGDNGVYDGFDWSDVEYTGYDVSQTAIDLARERRPNATFVCAETLDLPPADLLIVKDVMGHWNGRNSTVDMGDHLPMITDFLNRNYDQYRCIIIIDSYDATIDLYFPGHVKFDVQELRFNRKYKRVYTKEK
jgi:SAM-dependent methyltransferase